MKTATQYAWDGYFFYTVLHDSKDGWLTVSLAGHNLRIPKRDCVPVSETGFPLERWLD